MKFFFACLIGILSCFSSSAQALNGISPNNRVVGQQNLNATISATNLFQAISSPGAFTSMPPSGNASGKVYFDQNRNGVYDTGETLLSGELIAIQPGNINLYTDSIGEFQYGLTNGSYSVTWVSVANHSFVVSSDSVYFNVNINNNNVNGLDFGLVEGLVSVAPAIGFQGQSVNASLISQSLFLANGNPWGNITSCFLRSTTSPFYTYPIPIGNILVQNATSVQLLIPIPQTAIMGVYDVVIQLNNSHYYYLPEAFTITKPQSFLNGHCYHDTNNNSTYDVGEAPLSGVSFNLIPEYSFALSNFAGDFQFGANLGTHTLSYNAGPTQGLMLTTQPAYTFTNTGNQGGFDFGFRSNLPDYTSSLLFTGGVMRCNTKAVSTITYKNLSNVVIQGQIYLVPGSNLTYSSSTPPFDSMNGDTLFWNFSNLQSFIPNNITVSFLNPAAGSYVQFLSGIRVVDGSSNLQFEDTVQTNDLVRCSLDPNDKAAIPEGVDDVMHYTLNSDPLEYLIRFQNTGNDTAFTVYIRDTIDASLDISTLEVIASSHSVQTEVDSNRAAVFMFENILLVDSVMDEPNSHGFVRYRIHPNAALSDPTVVENTAYIYFDFNPAVVTNTTWNTLVQIIPVGISESIQVGEGVFFYPNPMDEKGYFSFDNPRSERMLLELFDVKGQKVAALESNGSYMELNRRQLSSGLYLFRLINTLSGKINSGKISIR